MLTVDCYDGDEQYNTRMTKMKQNFEEYNWRHVTIMMTVMRKQFT